MTWNVIDLFSGGGGASYGFHVHPQFKLVGAADAQLGKPSSGKGSLDCNSTYSQNMGINPVAVDLGEVSPTRLRELFQMNETNPSVMIACPPCTGFSRTNAKNHLTDDHRNGLVGRTAEFASEFQPEVILMENARELVMGRFRDHLLGLETRLRSMGYQVHSSTHFLSRFGLPQRRERAIVIAVKNNLPLYTLEDLWSGSSVNAKATYVRQAIWSLPPVTQGEIHPSDQMHVSPRIRDEAVRQRLHFIPRDGGSWFDLAGHPDSGDLLTPTMKDRLNRGDLGSHPDVYGRMWWDRPAPTIKRECSHVGNGRYSHPEQDRLCTVREMAILNGFPREYVFAGSINNMYRHIGDAVPPLISYQLAHLTSWILSGEKPDLSNLILPGTHLQESDILSAND